MKKLIFLALFLGFMANPAYAQTVQPQTQEEIVANLQALMVQLMDMVAKLTVQLNEALAAQNAKLDTIQTQQTQSAPVLGATEAAAVTIGSAYCNPSDPNKNTVLVPVTISAPWKYAMGEIMNGDATRDNARSGFSYGGTTIIHSKATPGTFVVKVSYTDTSFPTFTNPVYDKSFTGEVVLPSCH